MKCRLRNKFFWGVWGVWDWFGWMILSFICICMLGNFIIFLKLVWIILRGGGGVNFVNFLNCVIRKLRKVDYVMKYMYEK